MSKTINVVVVIATSMQRTQLLIERSLASVFHQKNIKPSAIYIVDDNNDEQEHHHICTCVEAARQSHFPVIEQAPPVYVIKNQRTKGASGSGAWNTAAQYAFSNLIESELTYLAFLDDDDEWLADYLACCISAVTKSNKKVAAVVSSFFRCELQKTAYVQIDRKQLVPERFFRGNPGWQGSNTFVEINSFWQAGGFDESMPSTLDRDFAIRLLDTCLAQTTQVEAIQRPLWKHHAHNGKRVTTCTLNKKRGLDLFYRKYASRMTKVIYEASLQRAYQLFSYTPEAHKSTPLQPDTPLNEFANERPVHILIGVTSSEATNIKLQINSLIKQIQQEAQFKSYCHYVVITNGNHEERIENMIASMHTDDIKIECINQAAQQAVYQRFPYRDLYQEETLNHKSIAHSRSLLQFICWEINQKNSYESITLILDDDLLFESLALQQQGVKTVYPNFLGKLSALKAKNKADLLISAYSDAPALPFYCSARTQLLDILFTLQHFSQETSAQNQGDLANILEWDDYYYDLSASNYQHLEHPIAICPSETLTTELTHSFQYFLKELRHFRKEANISRPLLLDPTDWSRLHGKNDFKRGGIAIFLNPSLLIQAPNLSSMLTTQARKRYSRRSDFISTMVMDKLLGKHIERISFPLRHHRRAQKKPCSLSSSKLADDIIGLCFYRCYQHVLQGEPIDQRIKDYFEQQVQNYLLKLKLSNLRIQELAQQIMHLIETKHAWWNRPENHAPLQKDLEQAQDTTSNFLKELAQQHQESQIRDVELITQSFDVVTELKQLHDFYMQRCNLNKRIA